MSMQKKTEILRRKRNQSSWIDLPLNVIGDEESRALATINYIYMIQLTLGRTWPIVFIFYHLITIN